MRSPLRRCCGGLNAWGRVSSYAEGAMDGEGYQQVRERQGRYDIGRMSWWGYGVVWRW